MARRGRRCRRPGNAGRASAASICRTRPSASKLTALKRSMNRSGSWRDEPSVRRVGVCTCASSQYVSAARPPSSITGDQATSRSMRARRGTMMRVHGVRIAGAEGGCASRAPCAARIISQSSRTAPLPPSRPVTKCARARTAGGACGTVTANPQRTKTGTSGRSSPMCAQAAGGSASSRRRASHGVSLSCAPCITRATPSDRARCITAGALLPVIHATVMPACISIFRPTPSSALNALNSRPWSST